VIFRLIRLWWTRKLVRRAKQLLEEEKFSEAAELALDAAQGSNGTLEAKMLMGMIKLKLEEYDDAATWFRAVLEAEPGHVDAKTHLAMTYARAKRWDKAMAVVEDLADKRAPRPPETAKPGAAPAAVGFQDPGRTAADMVRDRDWTALKAASEATLKANPLHAGAMLQLGMALYRLNKPADAMKYYDDALQIIKKDADKAIVNFNRGTVLMQLGRWEEACQTFDSLAAMPPEARGKLREEGILYNLGYCFSQRKMIKMARSTYERLERINPTYKDVALCLKHLRVPLAARVSDREPAGSPCPSCAKPMPLGAVLCRHCGWTSDTEMLVMQAST